MCKSTFHLLVFIALVGLMSAGTTLGFNAGRDPSLVGWWKLDDGAGATALDSSGNENHGQIQGDPVWVAGILGGALQFDGNGDYINCGNDPTLDIRDQITMSFWIKTTGFTTDWSAIISKGDGSWRMSRSATTGSAFHMGFGGTTTTGNTYMDGTITVTDGEWHHGAGVYDGAEARIYVDGVLDVSQAATGQLASATYDVFIGENAQQTGRYLNGTLDDVRIYNRALTLEELEIVMKGEYAPIAERPSPADEATDLPRDVVLSWSPGEFAAAHDVYFGTEFDDVNDASRTNSLGVLVSQGQAEEAYAMPTRLAFGTTYYWRVDEVNAAPDSTIFKGNVWSFTTEPLYYAVKDITVTASVPSGSMSGPPEAIVDESGLTDGLHGIGDADMWVSQTTDDPIWLQFDFDRAYKLYGMHIWNYNSQFESILGLGIKEATIEYATEPNEWIVLGDYELERGPSAAGYAGQLFDLDGLVARSIRINVNSTYIDRGQAGLSEIQFLYKPVFAREPEPQSGAVGVDPSVVLSWRPGREAASHEVYLSTDSNAVADGEALVATVSVPAYDTHPLDLLVGEEYYWMIAEVNEVESPTTWASDLWSFSTPEYLVVDDFEGYDDEESLIYETWADGYEIASNGSQVGYDLPPYAERTTVRGGSQSMPFQYGQDGATMSEAQRVFDAAQDWTAAGVRTLTVFFFGDPTNTTSQLYVEINNTTVNYNGAPADLQRRRWNQWNIDLTAVPAATLRNVQSLTIGVSGSGQGILLIDDLRLYRTAPEVPAPVDPGTAGLVAYYPFDNNVQDASGNVNHGTLVGAPTYAAGPTGYGQALSLDGTTDAVDLGNKAVWNPSGSFSVALWANAAAWDSDWAHTMIGNRGEDGLGWQVRRWGATANIAFTTRGVGSDDTQSVMAMPLDEWVHITCVYDNAANTKTIYFNGLQDRMVTTTAGDTVAATTHNTYIGARANSGNTELEAFFTGLLDEIRVYDRALSSGEARYLAGDR